MELYAEKRWGDKVMSRLSIDLHKAMPDAKCFSKTNLLYMKNFYRLYNPMITLLPPQVGEQLKNAILDIPWGHHKLLIDRCRDNIGKTSFFVRQIVENGWSRSMLLNFIDTDLFERQGKALTNFKRTLPDTDSDLTQELTKDPYDFAFIRITTPYNELILKDALLNNIIQ